MLAVLGVAAAPAAGQADLTGWSLVDPADAWTYTNPTPDSGRLDEAVPSDAAEPVWVVSDFTLAPSTAFSITLLCEGSDDDFIGFAFGYQDNDNFYLVDWKRTTQIVDWGDDPPIDDDVAEAGIKLKKVQGGWTRDGLWGGKDGLGVSELAGPSGAGWQPNVAYTFDVTLAPGQIVVELDGNPLFDVLDGTFSGGALTLYGFSQDNIVFSNVLVPGPPTGACCFQTGTCAEVEEAFCLANGGSFAGAGSTCAKTVCVTGACCLSNGTCEEVPAAYCDAIGGEYRGDDTTCATESCETATPPGACCFANGFCLEVTLGSCVTLGGSFQGEGTTCDADCPAATGACCVNESCVEGQTPQQCESLGGEYQGDGTTCLEVDCSLGGCCFPNGFCVEHTESFCQGIGGTYLGDGVPCTVDSCPGETLSDPSEFVATGEPTAGVARDAGKTASGSDLDGNGTPDLVVVIPDLGLVQVLLNRGNDPQTGLWRGLLKNQPFEAGMTPSGVDVEQLNGLIDAGVDVAVTDAASDTVTVFFNTNLGNGTFAGATTVAVGAAPSAVLARDLLPDPDGNVDLAVANEVDGTVSFLSGDGLGGFVVDHTVETGGLDPLELASGDYIDDKDECLDCLDVAGLNGSSPLAAAGPSPPGSVFTLQFKTGTGEFQLEATTEVGSNPKDLAAGDLDDDGRTDVAVVNADDESVSILIAQGDGTFSRTDIGGVGADPRSIDTTDVDGDGDLDLAVVADAEVVKVLFNITPPGGPALFTDPVSFIVDDNPAFEANPNFVVSADMDQDGVGDLMTLNEDALTGTGGSVSVLLRSECEADVNGDGMVDMLDYLGVIKAWGPCPDCPEDVDGDGVVNIVDLLQVLLGWGVCP